jgi:hypothetical protein
VINSHLELPVDATDAIAKAYGLRGTSNRRFPVLPQTVGLAIVLLVNQNTAEERAIGASQPYRHPGLDAILCEAAETFTRVLGYVDKPAWRGGALASLDALLGPGLFVKGHTFWVDEDRARLDARDWVVDCTGGRPFPRAFNAMAGNLLSHGMLAVAGCRHEEPHVTRQLRCHLQGHDLAAHKRDGHPECFPEVAR